MTPGTIASTYQAISVHDRRWATHAEQVGAFHRAHGRWPFRVADDTAEAKLGHWLSRNRAQARDGQFCHLLVPERLARLDEVAPGWRTSYDDRWRLVAQSLGRFRAERGRWPSTMALAGYERRLGTWLGGQRNAAGGGQYARYFTPIRREYLGQVAPGWLSNLRRDERGFAMLADDLGSFRLTYERWPQLTATDPGEARLARWLALQRKHSRGGPGSRALTWARRRHLNLAAPGWRKDDGITPSWVARADEVGDFHCMYGFLPRRKSSNPGEVILGQWLATQRARARGAIGLTDARRTYLNDAAPGWAPRTSATR
jgi:hypothetical protein